MQKPNIFQTVFTTRTFSGMFLFAFAIFATSCEKVIDLKLNDAEKKVVIEANLSDQPNTCKVMLSTSKNFNEANAPVGISNAVVTISDNNGAPVSLSETSVGVYESPTIIGVPGHTYQLKVAVNGNNFSASCTMPQKVPFDSLYITERTFFNETNKYATVKYKDPVNQKNAYRFIQYINGVKEQTLFVRDDDANDGLTINRTLTYFFDKEEKDTRALKSGDQVKIEMLSISYPIYKYWNSLAEGATGSNQSNTPANPLTNVQGGALGYFSVHTLQQKTVMVP